MSLAKSGEIQNVCLPNALLTFKEYLLDYADAATKEVGEAVITQNIPNITEERVRQETVRRLQQITEGTRDLYF